MSKEVANAIASFHEHCVKLTLRVQTEAAVDEFESLIRLVSNISD